MTQSATPAQNDRRIRHAARLAKRLLPTDGNLDGLLANLSEHRDRPIFILDQDLGADGPSGLWVETATADYVVVHASATPSRRAAIVCHEAAHMILGHEAQAGDLTELVSTIRPSLAARFLQRHGYSAPDEHDAETLATEIVAEQGRRARAARLSSDPVSRRLR